MVDQVVCLHLPPNEGGSRLPSGWHTKIGLAPVQTARDTDCDPDRLREDQLTGSPSRKNDNHPIMDFEGGSGDASFRHRPKRQFLTADRPRRQGRRATANVRRKPLSPSGLYGIVEADEPIQNYSCPIDHKSIDVQKIWRSNGVISQAIVEYISTLKQTQGIEVRRIIDLTAMKIYRDLVDWSAIHHQTRAEVLHCFHRKLAGDTALEAFATFFRDYLLMLSTEELLALEPDRRISFGKEHFVLTAKTDPPEGWARESIGTIATDPTHLEVVFRLYEEALTELERAVKALSSGEIRVMETAIDTGGSKIGKAFENALKIYLHVPEHEYVRWDRLVQNTMDQAKEVFTRDDVLRFNYIREQRNIAAHRYFSRFWELGMEVQTVHWLLVTLLKVRPDAITDPLLVLQRSNRNHP